MVHVVAVGCLPIFKKESATDPQAVKRFQQNGEFIIVAQKPDDMKIVAVSNAVVPFKTADGKRGRVSLVRNGEYNFISVREALADGFVAFLKDKSMQDVFLIPKVNGQPDQIISMARQQDWKIEQITASIESYAQFKDVRIYCPVRIEFRKKDGTKHVSEFPARPNCQSDIQTYIGDVNFF
ncbi:hypothetical protein EBR21_01770 [bacterium]|nr:hypothetical protein [bacterium]